MSNFVVKAEYFHVYSYYFSGNNQVWSSKNSDGSYNVALFNLSGSTLSTTVNFRDLGFTRNATLRDVWDRSDKGTYLNSYTTSNLLSHGCLFFYLAYKN